MRYYIPTVGLAKITNASKNGAAYLEYDIDDASVNFTSEVFTTHPGKELKISLILEGNENLPLIENNFISSSDKPDTFTVSVSEASIQDGFSLLALEVKDVNDEVLISAEIPFGDKDQEEAAVNNNIAEEPEIEPNKETESQTKIEPEKESNPALIIILAVLAIIVTVILSLYFIRNKKKKASS